MNSIDGTSSNNEEKSIERLMFDNICWYFGMLNSMIMNVYCLNVRIMIIFIQYLDKINKNSSTFLWNFGSRSSSCSTNSSGDFKNRLKYFLFKGMSFIK